MTTPAVATYPKEKTMTDETLPPQVQNWEQTQEPMTYAEAYQRCGELIREHLGPKKSYCLEAVAWSHAAVCDVRGRQETLEFRLFVSDVPPWAITAKSLESLLVILTDKIAKPPEMAEQLEAMNVVPTMEAVK